MTNLTIREEKPPEATFHTPRATFGQDATSPFRGGIDGSFAPAFEVREYLDHFEFEVDVPGVGASELAVFIAGGWVTVAGGRKQPADSSCCLGYRSYERGFGTFWRAFRLTPGVTSSGARAELRDGVLVMSVPKCACPARVGGAAGARAPKVHSSSRRRKQSN